MNFKEEYTTNEKKDADLLKDPKDQTEQDKTVITNDAYAVAESINLNTTMMRLRHGR